MVVILVAVVHHIGLGGTVVAVGQPCVANCCFLVIGSAGWPTIRAKVVEIEEVVRADGSGGVATHVGLFLAGYVSLLAVDNEAAITLVLAGEKG